jgi:hypothetical protein
MTNKIAGDMPALGFDGSRGLAESAARRPSRITPKFLRFAPCENLLLPYIIVLDRK